MADAEGPTFSAKTTSLDDLPSHRLVVAMHAGGDTGASSEYGICSSFAMLGHFTQFENKTSDTSTQKPSSVSLLSSGHTDQYAKL
jgi:hypothetical protein